MEYNIDKLEEHRSSPDCIKINRVKIENEFLNKSDYNVILIGDSGVGKSSLIYAYEHKRLDADLIAVTMEADRVLIKTQINNRET